MRNYFKRSFFRPSDYLFFLYNLSLILFISYHFSIIDNAIWLIMGHVVICLLHNYISYKYQNADRKIFDYLAILFPLASLSILHYESGILNLLIFPDYFDSLIRNIDKQIFGIHTEFIATKFLSGAFFAQFFHFFYSTYYILLFIPIIYVYQKEKREIRNKVKFFPKTERILFVLLFSMFVCYWIFMIFPVVGPVNTHHTIFKDYGGIVKLIDIVYKYGDSSGGAMPSSHVAASLVITIFSFKYIRKYALYILISFIFLTFGTVYCSFHYAIDAGAGLVFGAILYWAGNNFYKIIENRG